MRTMLLSFKADVYKRVLSGEKIYEHRKVFPDEPIEAFLYVSSPIKSIVGIMHLNNKKEIKNWKYQYKDDKEVVARVDEYLKHHKYVMEISDFQNTNMISLDTLRKEVPGFVVPQMYYFIDDKPLLKYLKQNLLAEGKKIEHSFENISKDQICKM